MFEIPICIRLGCANPRQPRSGRQSFKPWCSTHCRKWHRAYTAFSEGGAAYGRNTETDAALFSEILARLNDPRTLPVLDELFDVYGRA